MSGKLLLLALAMVVLAGCSKEQKKDEVSESAKKVIEAMMTCPNTDLFSQDAFTPIGEGVVITEEEKQKIQEANDKIIQNWETAVGKYFGYGYLEDFINTSTNTKYLADASLNGTTIHVVQMSLEEKNSGIEKISVTLSVDGEKQKVEVIFHYDTEGLIKTVEVA